jgi:heterodisulfide reductase subunit A-like polyferredoxin
MALQHNWTDDQPNNVLEEYENGSYCGGGLGGLATAALLAKAGFSVTFYEKRQTMEGELFAKNFSSLRVLRFRTHKEKVLEGFRHYHSI